MRELAYEAERAARNGKERFVGSASRFSMERSFYEDASPRGTYDDFVIHHRCSSKKIGVTSLRRLDEVIPSFGAMHHHLRRHFRVRMVQLEKSDARNPPAARDMMTEKEDDAQSQATSLSFNSFAVSLRGIVDYVRANNSHSLRDITMNTAAALKLRHSVSDSTARGGISYASDSEEQTTKQPQDYDGRASPSSVNGVLFGQVRQHSFAYNEEEKSPSSEGTVATFFSKLPHPFRRQRTITEDNRRTEDEENAHFITNFFYTHTHAHTFVSDTAFKLDTHPDHPSRKDGFCMTSGCVHNVGCESMVNALDLLVGWLEKHNCDPASKSAHDGQIVLQHGWMNEGERRFIPPRLGGFEVDYNS
jgi:hypothetical protein